MGTEAAAMAKEAENANEIIHYFAQEWAPGVVIHMQTMYMTWITMAIVFLLFFIASRNPKLVPSGLQNGMEFFIDFLNGLMEETLGMKGRKYMAPFMITLFMFIFIFPFTPLSDFPYQSNKKKYLHPTMRQRYLTTNSCYIFCSIYAANSLIFEKFLLSFL